MKRIIYYSKNDLAWIYSIEQINNYFTDYRHLSEAVEIDDILERQHIIDYLENGFLYKEWSSTDIITYNAVIKDFKKEIAQYFKNLKWESIIDMFSHISYSYTKTFWFLVNKTGIYKTINSDQFAEITLKKNFRLSEILYCKNIVSFLDCDIYTYMMSKPRTAEIFLDYFESSYDQERQEKFFPKSLNTTESEKLILSYLDYDDVNLNYVRLVQNSKDSQHLRITDRTRLKAKRISDRLNDEILNSDNAFSIKKGICLSEDQEEIKKTIYRDGEEIISYSSKKLAEKKDIATLFKNFRTIFNFLDFQGCIEFVSKSGHLDGFERAFMRSKNDYIITSAFTSSSMDSIMRFEIYNYFLKDSNLKLEDILDSYVINTLNSTYNIDKLRLNLPSQESSFLAKIRLIVPEFESLVEQYKLYVEDDIVDYELMQVSTKTTKISCIPSLLQKKYAYPVGDDYHKLKFTFFDSASYLFDYKKYGERYSNLYEVLRKENFNISDVDENRKYFLQSLITEGYLKSDEQGNISIVNTDTLIIIGYLKIYDVISYHYFPLAIQQELDRLNQMGMIKFSDKLFTIAEQEYFDYYLNNRFSNGLWLRNKYVHATNSHDNAEQERDYKILLKLMVLLILKIDDDLVIARSMFKNKIGKIE